MIEVTDGLSAFRLETEVRARGDGSAVAVYCISPGVRWFVVPADSEMRPDPVPPKARRWVVPWRRLMFVKRGKGRG